MAHYRHQQGAVGGEVMSFEPNSAHGERRCGQNGVQRLRQPLQVEISTEQMQMHQAPMFMELGIVGGLGLIVYFGPGVYAEFKKRVWPKISKTSIEGWTRVKRGLDYVRRKKRRGSIIRVIANILPNYFFPETQRIYITGIVPIDEGYDTARAHQMNRFCLTGTGDCADGRVEDGVIVAFELDDGDTEDTDSIGEPDQTSDPEGWENNLCSFPLFQPGANSTRFKCSTPTPSVILPDLCRKPKELNDSFDTDITDNDTNAKTQEELVRLRQMIHGLVQQVAVFSQNMTMQQNSFQVKNCSMNEGLMLPPPPPHLLTANGFGTPPPPPPPLPTFAEVTKSGAVTGGPPAPPPPPPPPMPPSVFQGSVSIKLQKSKVTEAPKPSAPSMMDVLRDLNKVKLRTVQSNNRSPGGTPVKKSRNDDRHSLEFALKKRFESMHSPPGSDDENADKENEFNDSLCESKSPQKQQDRNKTTLKSRNQSIGRKSMEVAPAPFGPHLLKKRNQNSPVMKSPLSK